MDFESNSELRCAACESLIEVYDVSYGAVNSRLPTYLRLAAWDTYASGLRFPKVVRDAAIWYQDHGAL